MHSPRLRSALSQSQEAAVSTIPMTLFSVSPVLRKYESLSLAGNKSQANRSPQLSDTPHAQLTLSAVIALSALMTINFLNYKVWLTFGGFVHEYFGVSFSLLAAILFVANSTSILVAPMFRYLDSFKVNRFFFGTGLLTALTLFTQRCLVRSMPQSEMRPLSNDSSPAENQYVANCGVFAIIGIAAGRLVLSMTCFAVNVKALGVCKAFCSDDELKFKHFSTLCNGSFTVATFLFFPTGAILRHFSFTVFLDICTLFCVLFSVMIWWIGPRVSIDDMCADFKQPSLASMSDVQFSAVNEYPMEGTHLVETVSAHRNKENASFLDDSLAFVRDSTRMAILIPAMFVAVNWGTMYAAFGPWLQLTFDLNPQTLGTYLTLAEGIGSGIALLLIRFAFKSCGICKSATVYIAANLLLSTVGLLLCLYLGDYSLHCATVCFGVYLMGYESLYISLLMTLQNYSPLEQMSFSVAVYGLMIPTINAMGQLIVSAVFERFGIEPLLKLSLLSYAVAFVCVLRMSSVLKRADDGKCEPKTQNTDSNLMQISDTL